MEIERKFLIQTLPDHLEQYPHNEIEQAYLCTDPVLRIRKFDDSCIFTYKSGGLMVREEIEVPLPYDSYIHLLAKCDGVPITKTRYLIPDSADASSASGHTIELDVFHGALAGLCLAEVEFSSEEDAHAYKAPSFLTVEVTSVSTFHNSCISFSDPSVILTEAKRLLTQKSL